MKVQVVSEDVGVWENGAKARVALKYSLAHPRTKLRKGVYELGDHVGEKALSSNSPPNLGITKKNFSYKFS